MARAGKGRDGSGDDDALWTHVARTVAPLRRRRPPHPAEPPSEPAPEKPARSARPRPVARTPSAPPPPAPELAAGAAPGLDRRTATRLRRGRLPVEGRIDLHGMTRDQAAAALERFLAAAHGAGRRCVLVITGKGLRGENGGVIRAELPRWLNRPALRPLVVAFAQAQPKDGGAGAFYVYLRRERAR